jgi:hypothetical protein
LARKCKANKVIKAETKIKNRIKQSHATMKYLQKFIDEIVAKVETTK